MKLSILFPAFCDALREPDPEFYREMHAVENLGLAWRIVDISALCRGEVAEAFRHFGGTSSELIVYRGWILHPGEYALICEAVADRGGRMLTSPEEYENALLFPKFFPRIADWSFPAVWIRGKSEKRAIEAARRLGPGPYFLKDYAKSAKEIWPDGCVAASEQDLAAAIRALAKYRGDRFEGGIVIRPLLRLRYVDENPFGGKIFEEYRFFFFQGRMLAKSAYDRLGGNVAALPDYSVLARRIASPFFSLDVVVTEAGQPLVLEAGDGGSSALPPQVSSFEFYSAILRTLESTGGNKSPDSAHSVR